MKQIYHFSDQLGSVDCIPCPEKNPSGLAEPVEQDFLTTVHLEVWPESHWPGFALRQADVIQSYTAW